MIKRHLWIVPAIYSGIAIATFGYAAASREKANAVECVAAQYRALCESSTPPEMAGLMAAILWPLYWSWEIAS